MTDEKKPSLIARFAAQFGIDPAKLLKTLKDTVFQQPMEKDSSGRRTIPVEVTDEQMMTLLIVAERYGLDPFTRELYAFADPRKGIIPIVSVDGWSRLVNSRKEFRGAQFAYGPANEKGVVEWIECTMHRSDRDTPTTVREFYKECKRDTNPWASHPNRMLRHKAFMQCGRIAFGFVGIFDEDEGRAIIDGNATRVAESSAIAEINADIEGIRKVADPQKAIEHVPLETIPTQIHATETVAVEIGGGGAAPGGKHDPVGHGDASPVPAADRLIELMQSRTDVDVLDADASLISEFDDGPDSARLKRAYREKRAALTGQ